MHGLEIGQRFERYRVLRVLGSGISGISYEAEDLMLHRKVALKLIHPWSALADSARRQFFRDMQSTSLLVHPYHAAILDYGEVEGQLYVARRFVSNGSLLSSEGRAWFSPPFSVADTLLYAHQLAQVLYNIHRYGYTHGSLTLSNILVLHGTPTEGETDFAPFLLSDIGLASFVRRFGHPQIIRLPITAAPEQWRGRYLPASDQYALATLVYLWLTGRPPFIGSPEEIEQAKYKAIFPTISSFNPLITLEQEGIIRRALSTHPDERYPTILSFIEVLQTSIARQTKRLEKLQAYELSKTAIAEPLTPPIETAVPLETFVPSVEVEQDEAPSPAESDITATANSTIDEDVEPITSTFLLDQNAVLLLTTIAKQEELPSETMPTPQSESDTSLPQPDEALLPQVDPEPTQPEPLSHVEPVLEIEPTQPEPLPQVEPTPQIEPAPTPQIEPDIPLPRPGETPLPHVEPAPETEPTQPKPSTPAEPATPEVLPPAPDIAQPLPEPTLPEVQPETTPTPSPDPEKAPEQPSTPTNIAITLTITSSYLSEPKELHLEKEEITLGRAGSSDILLDQDPLTSRHHAKLVRKDNQYYLYDLRSADGIVVNEQKLTPEVGFLLTDGDCIHICSYTLTLHLTPVPNDSEQKKEPAIS